MGREARNRRDPGQVVDDGDVMADFDENPMSDQRRFTDVASDLLQIVEAALPRLRSVSDAEAARPRAPGKWSAKQVIGHLVDSAANNHQRFVRAQQGTELEFPGYAQDHWISSQR